MLLFPKIVTSLRFVLDTNLLAFQSNGDAVMAMMRYGEDEGDLVLMRVIR